MSCHPEDKTASIWDVVQQAAIYGSYHNHPGNRFVHYIGVPTIILGLMVILAPLQLGATLPIPFLNPQYTVITAGFVLAVVHSAYCAKLEPVVGALLFLLHFSLWYTANFLYVTKINQDLMTTVYYFVILQVLGWGLQVSVGHGFFEGRKPAVADNYFQAMVSPAFLVLEILFAIGYRPELEKKVQAKVDEKIKYWKDSLAKQK